MDDISQAIHRFLVQDFNQVLRWEEKVLSSYQQGKLSVNEFHIIEAVFLAMDAGLNNMGEISRAVGGDDGHPYHRGQNPGNKGLSYPPQTAGGPAHGVAVSHPCGGRGQSVSSNVS